MTLLSRALTTTGSLLLAHAAYSAHEHASLSLPSSSLSSSPLSPAAPIPAATGIGTTDNIPLDVIVETLVAVVLLCLGIVLSNSADGSAGTGKGKGGEGGLRPVEWGVWGGGVERSGGGMGNPFRALEVRKGFLDVRKQRREFADWVRENGVVGGK